MHWLVVRCCPFSLKPLYNRIATSQRFHSLARHTSSIVMCRSVMCCCRRRRRLVRNTLNKKKHMRSSKRKFAFILEKIWLYGGSCVRDGWIGNGIIQLMGTWSNSSYLWTTLFRWRRCWGATLVSAINTMKTHLGARDMAERAEGATFGGLRPTAKCGNIWIMMEI